MIYHLSFINTIFSPDGAIGEKKVVAIGDCVDAEYGTAANYQILYECKTLLS